MNIAELHAHPEARAKVFPITTSGVFLAHAGVSPLPACVAEAMQRYLQKACREDQDAAFGMAEVQSTRAAAAALVGAQPEEIALVGPTSLALSLIASGIKLRKTDNVVVYFDDFPSNVYPWLRLADAGVEVRFLNVRKLGEIRPIDVLGQVDEQTRLVALASCHFVSGYRLDLEAIGKGLRARGILFCLDGIQTAGAFPTPALYADFIAADAHKWMLGPCGAGFLYVSKRVIDRITPQVFGWNNVRCPDFVAGEEIVFRSGARKFEAGSLNLAGLAGMKAGIDLLLQFGLEAIASTLLQHRKYLIENLLRSGFEVLCHDLNDVNASAIVSFMRPGEDPSVLHTKLAGEKIWTSLRSVRGGQRYIRVAPHFYNTRGDLDLLLSVSC